MIPKFLDSETFLHFPFNLTRREGLFSILWMPGDSSRSRV